MYRAVVFDMDGVLVDTEKIYRKCWKENGMSIGIPEAQMENVCDRVAGGNKTSNARVFKEIMGEDFDYLAFRQRTMDLFDEHVEKYGIDIKPHVEDTLRFLKEHGVKMALATSTARTRAQQRLDSVGIAGYFDEGGIRHHEQAADPQAGYFDEKVCGDEITHGKPEPDIYLKACGKLGVNPDEAVAVEDSVNGIISASRAGLCTVMVVDLIKPNGITRERAYKTFYDIEDICSLFE